jgi:hypothetical protein
VSPPLFLLRALGHTHQRAALGGLAHRRVGDLGRRRRESKSRTSTAAAMGKTLLRAILDGRPADAIPAFVASISRSRSSS